VRGETVVRNGRTYQSYSWGNQTYHRYHANYRHRAPNVCRHFRGRGDWVWDRFEYRWNWIYHPWWDSYRYYYRPYIWYVSPAWWLTDYVFITTLYAPTYASHPYGHYGQGYEDGYARGYRDALVSESLKEQIRSQIDDELYRNQYDLAPASLFDQLYDPNHVFIVSKPSSGGSRTRACILSEGDLIKPIEQGQGRTWWMRVVVSKTGSCWAGSEVLVSLEDLEEFQNHFSESIEEGLVRLESEQFSRNW
jgi:hypothetical protein